jgi:hypothetical protein
VSSDIILNVHYTFCEGYQTGGYMSLHEDAEEYSFSDYNYDDEVDDIRKLDQKKKVKRLLEERLERKRLKDEFKDDFDELSGEFDWDDIDK